MEKTLLWIDDIRDPNDNIWSQWLKNTYPEFNLNITWCKTFLEVKTYIDTYGIPDIICFDHDLGDLGDYEKNGYTCVKYITEYCSDKDIDIPLYSIQSANIIGAENMRSLLNNYHKNYIKYHE